MRYFRGLVVLLVISLAVNVIVYAKFRGSRPLIQVNGEGFSKRDLDNYLEGQAGETVKAQMTERMLTEQAAAKQGVSPTAKEVDDEYNTQRELNWQFAMKVDREPWAANAEKEQIRQELSKQRLRTKSVAVTDDEIKQEYDSRPSFYDAPNKATANLALVQEASIINDVRQLLSTKPPVDPATIREKFMPYVAFIGAKNVFTFVQPLGQSSVFKEVFAMKPGDVLQLPPTPEFTQRGIKAMLVRLIGITPGHKADLNDPATRSKIRTNVALRRSKPWQEVLSELWSAATFESEDPRDKTYIEQQLFPERAGTN